MRIVDFLQGSADWLLWREGGIGGSDAPAIMGASPYQTRQGLLIQKVTKKAKFGRKTNTGKTSAMMRGINKEPEVRQDYIDRTGNVIKPACCISDEYPWMRASLDGLTNDLALIVEIKCPKYEDHFAALAGTVPSHYWPQVQHQLACTGCSRLHYVSWSDNKRLDLPTQALAIVKVKPDKTYIDYLIAEESAFVQEMTRLRGNPKKLAAFHLTPG